MEMKKLISLVAIFFVKAPSVEAAYTPQQLNVSNWFGGGLTYTNAVDNIISTLINSIFYVAAAAFLLGSGMLILGFVSEENKSRGKNLMIGSLIGMALALSAKAIFNTALYFVYGT